MLRKTSFRLPVRIVIFIFFIFSLFSSHVFSQNLVKGKITDAQSGEALAFVNIVYDAKGHGLTSGIDGKFSIDRQKIEFLQFSYVGYLPQKKILSEFDNSALIIIKLQSKPIDIQEIVVVPGENPAHRIIKEVLKNRDMNNPEKMSSFTCFSYDKMVFTLDPESVRRNDSIFKQKKDSLLKFRNDSLLKSGKTLAEIAQMDTMNRTKKNINSFSGFADFQHLFLMETITERKFRYPDQKKENILATRVSGLKNPTFTLLASQLQSFSFYNELITISEKTYLNPISSGSTRKYLFIVEDTVFTEIGDTVFVISFRPKKNTTFNGLKGILNINTHGYAIQSVKAEPFDSRTLTDIKIQQKYELIEGRQWFPVELNTDIIFKNVSVSISGSMGSVVGIGKSYISDIVLNPELKRNEFSHIELEMDSKATALENKLWQKYRIDSLNLKEINTYRVIDSLGKAAHFDNKLKIIEILSKGYIPYHFLNFDYNHFVSYNKFEGLRLGVGAETNEKLLSWFYVGGYAAYGFSDKTPKYGLSSGLRFLRTSADINFRFAYQKDVFESGGYSFFEDKNRFSSEIIRKYLISDMFDCEQIETSLSFRTLHYFRVKLFARNGINKINNALVYTDFENNQTIQNFKFTEAGINFRFAYHEKFMKSLFGLTSLGTKYPVLYFNFAQGFNNLGGRFEYKKIMVKLSQNFITKIFGKTKLTLTSGYIIGELPSINLFGGHGSYYRFSIESENSFNTMRINEFLSDRYVAFYFKQEFGNALYKHKKSQARLVFVTNATYGQLSQSKIRQNYGFKTLEKGYFESGILLNNLYLVNKLIGFGVGGFYRYGTYRLPRNIDNFAFKITFKFNL